MSTQRNYNWQQTEPGLWQRHIDEIEEFCSAMAVLYEGSGRMFFGITGHISLTFKSTKNPSSENVEREVDQALRKA